MAFGEKVYLMLDKCSTWTHSVYLETCLNQVFFIFQLWKGPQQSWKTADLQGGPYQLPHVRWKRSCFLGQAGHIPGKYYYASRYSLGLQLNFCGKPQTRQDLIMKCKPIFIGLEHHLTMVVVSNQKAKIPRGFLKPQMMSWTTPLS